MKTKAKAKWVLEMRSNRSWVRWGSYDSIDAALKAGDLVARPHQGGLSGPQGGSKMSLSTGPVAPNVPFFEVSIWHKKGYDWSMVVMKDRVTRYIGTAEIGPEWALYRAHLAAMQQVAEDCRINGITEYQLNVTVQHGVIRNDGN